MTPDRLGTAQWADPAALADRFAFREGAFWLGRSTYGDAAVGFADDRHVCVVGGTGAGKGASVLIPNICLWPGSLVVVDPTGEQATLTAERRGSGSNRCEGMGQQVHVLDPYGVASVEPRYRSRFNPLDMLDPTGRSVVRDAQVVASALIPTSSDDDPWAQGGARRLLAGIILHVVTAPEFDGRRNLITVRELVFRGDLATLKMLRAQDPNSKLTGHALLWSAMRTNEAVDGEVAGCADEFESMMNRAPEQWAGVYDVAIRSTNFVNNDEMRTCLERSDLSLGDLKTNPRGVSLFITLPARHMDEDFRWLRLVVSLVTIAMEATPGQPATRHPTLMILDEFAGLKRMERIETGIAQIRKFGVKLVLVLQDLAQLEHVYEKNWPTFMANCSVKLFFGIEDVFTRRYVSELAGETELRQFTDSRTSGSAEIRTSTSTRGKTLGTQESEGWSKGDSYKRMPGGLRDTASLLRKFGGSVQASDSREGTRGFNSTTEEAVSEAQSSERQSSSTHNEHIHKRALVTPDEVGRFFRRVETSEQSPMYPGLAIAFLGGREPAVVRRTNYFEDPKFKGLYRLSDDEWDRRQAEVAAERDEADRERIERERLMERERQRRSLREKREQSRLLCAELEAEIAALRRRLRKLGPLVLPMWMVDLTLPAWFLFGGCGLALGLNVIAKLIKSYAVYEFAMVVLQWGPTIGLSWGLLTLVFVAVVKPRNSLILEEIESRRDKIERLEHDLNLLDSKSASNGGAQ